MISGILAVDKPLGWTSHDVVARIRGVTRQRQVGHAGTLDPLATGVLLLVLGQATRLSSYLMASHKIYCAEIVLGATTVTDDGEAPLQARRAVDHLDREAIERCLHRFRGVIRQTPPAYAAIKQGGEKLYTLARKGIAVEPVPRDVTIDRLEILHWDPPRLRLSLACGPGTYVRALARDVGAALDVGAYLHALRRVASGGFSAAHCHRPAALNSLHAVEQALVAPDRAVAGLPAVVLSAGDVQRARHGLAIRIPGAGAGAVRLYDATGSMLALAVADGQCVKPVHVFEGGEERHADGR